jgi:cytochrome c peroxidase
MNPRWLTLCAWCAICGALAVQAYADENRVPSKSRSGGSGASVLNPLPAPVQTPNVVPLSDAEQLGKDIFFDHTLSNPSGYACATCHIPQSGFTGPSSALNQVAGPVPGVVPGRFGRRKPQSIPYSTFSPEGPYLNGGLEGGTYLGGEFWDGRMPDNAAQAKLPFMDQNEMANTPVGPFPPHAGGYSPLVAQKLHNRPYAPLFQKVFGRDVFKTSTPSQIYDLLTAAIAKYEASAELNQFSSKFDASTNGTPPLNRYQFNASEANGMQLFFGKAQCSQCHSAAALDAVSDATQGKETFTMYCYANIGLPANPGNPYYSLTNCDADPEGCNPLGPDFIDYGLGANPNPAPDGTKFFNTTPGDITIFRGLFKAPSLRNVDLRPYPGFVKSFMHNGVFKSLEEVVHFYNKRNIATNAAGDEVSFVLYQGAPPGFTAIFPPPEVMDNVQNLYGLTPDQAANAVSILPAMSLSFSLSSGGDPTLIPFNGQVGHLELTAQEETDLVNFLKTLTDGYTSPNPVKAGWSPTLKVRASPSASGSFVMQIAGTGGQFYVVQTSTNLTNWFPVATNVLTSTAAYMTNSLKPGVTSQFWRVVPAP